MFSLRSTLKLILATGLIAVTCLGAISLLSEVQAAGPCRCPLIYAPVQCDHGKIYPNQCEADCHNAKHCVPIGPA